jgi:phosphoglucosamine mutase
MGRLFGTDGVRGRAGEPPLDADTIRRLGAALVRALRQEGGPDAVPGPIRFLSGRDTRESGSWIERELSYGIASEDAAFTSAGVMPTPAVAYLTPRLGYTAGVVISASHNPFADNGIKVFSGGGAKLTDLLEQRVEAIVADASWSVAPGEAPPAPQADLRQDYLAHLADIVRGRDLSSLRLVVDCANGATTTIAPRLFAQLGVDAHVIAAEPDGRNINLRCGSTDPERLAEIVARGGYRLGVAYDGDGDRAIFVDAAGRVVDGDAVMLMCARRLKSEGRLKGNAVVATVMSNIGLEIALRQADIDIVRCPVGDKHVMQEMLERGLSLGGEQSGHVIWTGFAPTGDGIAASLLVARALGGRPLADAIPMTKLPQTLVNVEVADQDAVEDAAELWSEVEREGAGLEGRGRVLVRPSGTEPLVRVMVEAPEQSEADEVAGRLVAVVKRELS